MWCLPPHRGGPPVVPPRTLGVTTPEPWGVSPPNQGGHSPECWGDNPPRGPPPTWGGPSYSLPPSHSMGEQGIFPGRVSSPPLSQGSPPVFPFPRSEILILAPPLPGGEAHQPGVSIPKWGAGPSRTRAGPSRVSRGVPPPPWGGSPVVSPPIIGGVSPEPWGSIPRTMGVTIHHMAPSQPGEGLAIHHPSPYHWESVGTLSFGPPPPRGGAYQTGTPPPVGGGFFLPGEWNPGGCARRPPPPPQLWGGRRSVYHGLPPTQGRPVKPVFPPPGGGGGYPPDSGGSGIVDPPPNSGGGVVVPHRGSPPSLGGPVKPIAIPHHTDMQADPAGDPPEQGYRSSSRPSRLGRG